MIVVPPCPLCVYYLPRLRPAGSDWCKAHGMKTVLARSEDGACKPDARSFVARDSE